MASGGLPSSLSISAPISASGVVTRPIGRFCREKSPVITESKAWGANKPLSSRILVPEFPISRTFSGALRPCMPTPSISIRPCCGPRITTPMSLNAWTVHNASWPSRNPVAVVVPSAKAPNMTVRCDIDLSPGTRNEPVIDPPGSTKNFMMFPLNHSQEGG